MMQFHAVLIRILAADSVKKNAAAVIRTCVAITDNELRDITASLLKETCHGVATEPTLQPVTSETFEGASTNKQDGARLDVVVDGFWGGTFERTYLDVRVFNPLAPSNQKRSMSATYRSHEKEKKRQYEQRVRQIEHSSFCPLVFSLTGGLAPIATTFLPPNCQKYGNSPMAPRCDG